MHMRAFAEQTIALDVLRTLNEEVLEHHRVILTYSREDGELMELWQRFAQVSTELGLVRCTTSIISMTRRAIWSFTSTTIATGSLNWVYRQRRVRRSAELIREMSYPLAV